MVSVRKWGGEPDDYLRIHDFIDLTKIAHPDLRHRAILHNATGCYIAEMVFGHNIENSNGKLVSVRDIAEQHILDDLGFIPTISDYLNLMPMPNWIGGRPKKHETIKLNGSTVSLQELKDKLKSLPEDMVYDGSRPDRTVPNYTQELVD